MNILLYYDRIFCFKQRRKKKKFPKIELSVWSVDCGRFQAVDTFHQHSRVSPKDLILDVEKKKSRRPVDISGFASSVQTTVCEEGSERKETHR